MTVGRERHHKYNPAADSNQSNFLEQIPLPPRYTGGSTVVKDLDVKANMRLGEIHRAFNTPNDHARGKMLTPDASKDTREFFKQIGWTQKARTEALNGHWNVAMFKLKMIGVFDLLTPDISLQRLQEVVKIIEEYDREHHMTRKKWAELSRSDMI